MFSPDVLHLLSVPDRASVTLLCLERHLWNFVKVESLREGRQEVSEEALKDDPVKGRWWRSGLGFIG